MSKNILEYQEGRTLDTCPMYRTAFQLSIREAGSRVFAGLKVTGLDVYLESGRVLHYDLEGRLLKVSIPGIHWRRGLSHRAIRIRKLPRGEGGGLERRFLTAEETDSLVDEASQSLQPVRLALEEKTFGVDFAQPSPERALEEIGPILARAAAFDAPAAWQALQKFRAVYGDIPVLPPDQYGSLVVLATEGCAYNHCTFCGFYRGVKYRAKEPGEFHCHVQQVIEYHGNGLSMRRDVFLGQANALTVPRERRRAFLEILNDFFEFPEDPGRSLQEWWQGSNRRFEGISSFLDAFTGCRIHTEEFEELRKLHLRRVFLGVETGDDDLLEWLNKPATAAEMLATVEAAKASELQMGVILLIGAGGERYFEPHIRRTVDLVNGMGLRRGDYVYLSRLAEAPGAGYSERARADGVEPLSPERLEEQERRIREGLKFASRRDRPYVAPYDITRFFY